MRTYIRLAALFAFALPRLVAAAACDGSALMIDGFQTGGTCPGYGNITNWSNAGLTARASGFTDAFGTINCPEGAHYGEDSWAFASLVTHSLPAASFPAGIGTNWSTHQFIHMAYATLDSDAATFVTSLFIDTVANGSVQFEAPSANVLSSSPVAANGWTYDVISIEYAKNLGIDLASVNSITIQQQQAAPNPGTIGYDHLRAVDGAPAAIPAVPAVQIVGTIGCFALQLDWPAQAAASEPLAGYHIYKSNAAGGPWTSEAYVTSGTTYIETVFTSTTEYFIIQPYSSVGTAFGPAGSSAVYMGCKNSTIDPAWTETAGGIHEALINIGTAAMFNPQGGCPTQTFTFSPTFSATYTPTPSPTMSFTDSPTFSFSPTITETFTFSPTLNGTVTVTPTISNTALGTFTDSPTPTPVLPSPTPTVSATFTITPTVPVGPGTQIYPNPFNPDKGQVFHIGNVKAGQVMKIYNMIGELVYSLKLQGDPMKDFWNGDNNNGVRVVTGIYVLVLSGGDTVQTYRVAVVRESK